MFAKKAVKKDERSKLEDEWYCACRAENVKIITRQARNKRFERRKIHMVCDLSWLWFWIGKIGG
jgi:hypothetical protein